jgi:hypothetical protein
MFFLKAFYWGHMSARENFSLQLSNIVKKGREALGGIPVIIGECGIPFDMKCGRSFFDMLSRAHVFTARETRSARVTGHGRHG